MSDEEDEGQEEGEWDNLPEPPEDPRRKTIAGFIAALEVFARYQEKGLEEAYFCGAEHDVIHAYVELDKLRPDSEDGTLLRSLGWHPDTDSENWAYFT